MQEGQTVKLDASDSSDTAGGTLSFAWTQTAGATASIDNATLAKPTITAPEVTADTLATFKVTVTSGALVASATVDITFADIAQTPVYAQMQRLATARFNLPVRAIAGDQYGGVVGVAATSTDPMTFAEFAVSDSTISVPSTPAFSTNVGQPGFVTALSFPGLLSDPTHTQILAGETATNRLRLFRRNAAPASVTPPGYSEYIDKSVTRACAFATPFQGINGQRTLLVGQRMQGFSVFTATDDTLNSTGTLDEYAHVDNGKSYCALYGADGPLNSPAFTVPSERVDVIAIDTDNNTIDAFTRTTPTTYTLKSSTPIQLNATKPLKFVGSAQLDVVTGHGLALVFTDGVHDGEHRLVLVSLDSNYNVVQDVRSWPLGVPVAVLYDTVNEDFFPELIVITSTSPQAVVFKSVIGGPSSFQLPATPGYVEIGLGATAVLPIAGTIIDGGALAVVYRDKQEIRLLQPTP